MSTFKFVFLEPGSGDPATVFSKRATVDPQALTLAGEVIPLDCIIAARRLGPTVVQVVRDSQTDHPLAVRVDLHRAAEATRFVAAINPLASRARLRRLHAEAPDRAAELRAAECPCCRSLINLRDTPASSEIYCPFCGRNHDPEAREQGPRAELSACPECHFYGRVREFSEWSMNPITFSETTRRLLICDACTRRRSLRMLLINTALLIGLPFAIVQFIRNRLPSSRWSAGFEGLREANSLAARGRARAAIETYDRILAEHPAAAGIWYNRALASLHAASPDIRTALADLRNCLDACANFRPAIDLTATLANVPADRATPAGARELLARAAESV